MDTIEVSPSYGRDYKSAAEVKAAWEAGKDFTIETFGSDMGRQINKQDAERSRIDTVMIRYARLTKVVVVKVRRGNPSKALSKTEVSDFLFAIHKYLRRRLLGKGEWGGPSLAKAYYEAPRWLRDAWAHSDDAGKAFRRGSYAKAVSLGQKALGSMATSSDSGARGAAVDLFTLLGGNRRSAKRSSRGNPQCGVPQCHRVTMPGHLHCSSHARSYVMGRPCPGCHHRSSRRNPEGSYPVALFRKKWDKGRGGLYVFSHNTPGVPTLGDAQQLAADLGAVVDHVGMGVFIARKQGKEVFSFLAGGAMDRDPSGEFSYSHMSVEPGYRNKILSWIRRRYPGLIPSLDKSMTEYWRKNPSFGKYVSRGGRR